MRPPMPAIAVAITIGSIGLAGIGAIAAETGASARPQSQGAPPGITLLYQNFPNPFPSGTSATTCLWFDLRVDGAVTLGIYDLRGRLVRTVVPSPLVAGVLPAGRYGRQTASTNLGCDPAFAWDGRGSDGHRVPPGVYLARLRADGRWQSRKIVFRGP